MFKKILYTFVLTFIVFTMMPVSKGAAGWDLQRVFKEMHEPYNDIVHGKIPMTRSNIHGETPTDTQFRSLARELVESSLQNEKKINIHVRKPEELEKNGIYSDPEYDEAKAKAREEAITNNTEPKKYIIKVKKPTVITAEDGTRSAILKTTFKKKSKKPEKIVSLVMEEVEKLKADENKENIILADLYPMN